MASATPTVAIALTVPARTVGGAQRRGRDPQGRSHRGRPSADVRADGLCRQELEGVKGMC